MNHFFINYSPIRFISIYFWIFRNLEWCDDFFYATC